MLGNNCINKFYNTAPFPTIRITSRPTPSKRTHAEHTKKEGQPRGWPSIGFLSIRINDYF